MHWASKLYLTNLLFHTFETEKISQKNGLRIFLEKFNSPWLQRSSGPQDVLVVPEWRLWLRWLYNPGTYGNAATIVFLSSGRSDGVAPLCGLRSVGTGASRTCLEMAKTGCSKHLQTWSSRLTNNICCRKKNDWI